MLAKSPAARRQRRLAAAKQARYRRRRTGGRGSLRLDDIDLIAAEHVLERLGMLPAGGEHSRADIAAALSRQIADWLAGWSASGNAP